MMRFCCKTENFAKYAQIWFQIWLVDTNAYKLQPSLSERVIVDGHGCHTALHFGVKT